MRTCSLRFGYVRMGSPRRRKLGGASRRPAAPGQPAILEANPIHPARLSWTSSNPIQPIARYLRWGEDPIAPGRPSVVSCIMRTEASSHNPKSPSTQPPPPAVPMKPITVGDPPSREEIARKAHGMYVNQGCQHGKDVQHWLAAEAQVIKSQRDDCRGIVL
jgi:hypothetical protein